MQFNKTGIYSRFWSGF